MQILFADGVSFQGSPIDIVSQMRDTMFTRSDLPTMPLGDFIDWLRGELKTSLGVLLDVPPGNDKYRCVVLLRRLLDAEVIKED